MPTLLEWLGQAVSSPAWQAYVSEKSVEQRSYPDICYYNIRQDGVSFQVDPATQKILTIDLYNSQARWGAFPHYPLEITIRGSNGATFVLPITPTTTAIELVRTLGEPSRKGGGDAGGTTARALGPAMWTEWACLSKIGLSDSLTPLYLLAEYGGEAARAKDRWEPGRGSEARWATIALSIVPPRAA